MAKVTTNRAVKTSCKNTKVRTASGACAPERKPMMKSGGTVKKSLPKAQDGIQAYTPRGGAYVAWKKGSLTRNYSGDDSYLNKSMDTTGYSKGKKEFDFNRSTYEPDEGTTTTTTKVQRKDVPAKIAELKKASDRTVIESKKHANKFTVTEHKVKKPVKKPFSQTGSNGVTMKKGGTTKSFPDLNKDGKVTKADILIGKKVIPKAEVGGTTESCGPGKPKGCGYAKAQRKNSRSKAMSKVGPVVAKVLTTAATIGGLAYGAMKGKKMLENKKSGGTTHPGFKAVQSKIAAKQGISKEAAGAILASSTRKASTKAKAANPRLKKVK